MARPHRLYQLVLCVTSACMGTLLRWMLRWMLRVRKQQQLSKLAWLLLLLLAHLQVAQLIKHLHVQLIVLLGRQVGGAQLPKHCG